MIQTKTNQLEFSYKVSFYLFTLVFFCGLRLDQWPVIFAAPFFVLLAVLIIRNRLDLLLSVFTKKIFILYFILQSTFWLLSYIASYYSVSYNLDTAWFSNAISNYVNGFGFYSSILQIPQLSDHFSPNLLLLSPFYYFDSTFPWILIFRILAFVCSVFFLSKLLKELNVDENLRYLILILWMINSAVTGFMSPDFNPSTLAVPFIFLLFLFSIKGKNWYVILLLIFLLGFKSQTSIIWIVFGFYLFFIEKKYKEGIAVCIAGIIAGFAIVYWITPFLTGMQNIHSGEINPFLYLPKKGLAIFEFLLCTGFVAFLNWRYVIVLFPALGLVLLTGVEDKIKLTTHYGDIPVAVTFVIIAFIFKNSSSVKLKLEQKSSYRIWFLVFILGFFIHSQVSSVYFAFKNRPNDYTLKTVSSMNRLSNSLDSKIVLYVQSDLSPYVASKYGLRILENKFVPLNESNNYLVIISDHKQDIWPFTENILEVIQFYEMKSDSGFYKRRLEYLPVKVYESVDNKLRGKTIQDNKEQLLLP